MFLMIIVGIELANNNDCIIVKTDDDEEFKEINIISKEDTEIIINDIVVD
jgi:hypothetical protein